MSAPNNRMGNPNLRAPTPVRPSPIKLSNSGANLARNVFYSSLSSSIATSRSATPLTPQPNPVEQTRLEYYNLDVPNTTKLDELYDPQSRFFGRVKPRTLELQEALPYETELPLDQSRYLSHIISHLYAAIKSLDINGVISVSPKDLEKVRSAVLKKMTNGNDSSDDNIIGHDSEYEDHQDDDDDDDDDDEEDDDDDDDVDEQESDEEEEELGEDIEDDMSGVVSGGINSASTSSSHPDSSIVVSVRHWTKELYTWIKMKNDMPFDLRISLSKVYYNLCLVAGQGFSISVFVKMFALLTKYEPDVLKKRGLNLDYRPLFKLLDVYFPHAHTVEGSVVPQKKHLVKLGMYSNYFFSDEDFDEIFNLVGSRFSLNTASLALTSMCCLLPLSNPRLVDVTPSLFHIWTIVTNVKGMDSPITETMGTGFARILSEHVNDPDVLCKFGKYGFLNADQLLFVFSKLLNSFDIQSRKFGSSASSHSYAGYANIIVFSMNGELALEPDGGVFFHLETLLNSMETYLHPSNTGVWSVTCTKFIQLLIYLFRKRHILESDPDEHLYNLPEQNKLSPFCVKRFVKILLPKVMLGIQSKSTAVVNINCEALNMLCSLAPELVLNVILLDIYESLQTVITNHRLTVVLKILTRISKYFLTQKIFRCHVTRILGLLLPGIDSNDLDKTFLTLNVISSFASFLPFYDLSRQCEDDDVLVDSGLAFEATQSHLAFLEEKVYNNMKIEDEDQEFFQLDDEYEKKVLISSSTLFEDFLSMFTYKVFTLLENLSDQSNVQSNSELNLETSLPRTFLLLFESMADDYFCSIATKFLNFINENLHYDSIDLTAQIIGSIVKHDPKGQTPQFMELVLDKINDELENGSAGKVRSTEILHRDKPLYCLLTLLGEIVRYAGSNVLSYSYRLSNLSRLLLREVKGPIIFPATFFVTQLLKSLTTIRLEEQRLVSPSYVEKNGITETCWGGFYDRPERFNAENLKFGWHIPNKKEVEFAVHFFSEHVQECFTNLDKLMRDANKRGMDTDSKATEEDDITEEVEQTDNSSPDLLDFTDNFRKNLFYLSHSTSGIAYLLDPAYEDITKATTGNHKLNAQLLDKRLRSLNFSQRSLNITGNAGNPSATAGDDHSAINTDVANTEATTPCLYSNSDQNAEKSHDLGPKEPFIESDESIALSRADSGVNLANMVPIDMSRESSENNVDMLSLSGVRSPELDNDVTNPAITSRAQKIYTCSYFFGNTKEERHKNDLYRRVHALYRRIGEKLHDVCMFLLQYYPNDVKLFKVFLHTVETWFCDYGAENSLKSFDDNHISYKYMRSIQGSFCIRKPFTRITIGARVERYHRQRMLMHASSRFQSKLDETLLGDLIKLSLSLYSSISASAQLTLKAVMKKSIGSYALLINTVFENLSNVLLDNDYKRIKSALNVFSVTKLKNRISSDYKNLVKYVKFLLRCMEVDDEKTSSIAKLLYGKLAKNIKVPSTICIFNEDSMDVIRPADSLVDIDIKLLKTAKENKRATSIHFLRQLQKLILGEESKSDKSWQVSLINIELLVRLQSSFSMNTNSEIFELFMNSAAKSHPSICHMGIYGALKSFTKIMKLSNCSYDLKKLLDPWCYSDRFEIISTDSKSNGNFTDKFFNELQKTEDADYYFDTKIFRGWLFWGKDMVVAKNQKEQVLKFNNNDKKLFSGVDSHITKEWFRSIVKLIIEDNEEGSRFQGNNIQFMNMLIVLIYNKYLTNITIEDMITVLGESYVHDEKSTHIITCEALCSFLLAAKYTPAAKDLRVQEYVIKTIATCFRDLSPDTKSIWKIFSFWIVSYTDTRRYDSLVNEIFNYETALTESSPFKQATRLSCLKVYLTSVTWKYRDADKLIESMLQLMFHPYQTVRDQVAATITVALYCGFNESYPDCDSFVKANSLYGSLGLIPFQISENVILNLRQAFAAVESFRNKINEGDNAQETLKTPYIYGARTLIVLITSMFRTNACVGFVDLIPELISPFLLNLEHMRDVCKLANISPSSVYLILARIPFRIENIKTIVDLILHNGGVVDPSWHQRLTLLSFTEIFYFRQLLLLNSDQRKALFSYVSELLFNRNLEVREAASKALSGMVHCSPTKEREDMIHYYIGEYAKILQKYKKLSRKQKKTQKKFSQADSVTLHGASLGLGALISAFPYLSPPPSWFPDVLGLLANNSYGISGVVDKTSKGILSNFKKTRQDTWHIDSKVFTEEQLEDLEGVLRESYFV
ncbi:Blm10 protein [Saccharomycopsis crataegensis]|uniref:Blm10 protein n=1 Tax=Saccharomycopsis crataegensis TaxID=43959 RepID=A0AAV5QD99_9ASCO|nr:Blm10 protein [Saccharomycopsis crataegensis]